MQDKVKRRTREMTGSSSGGAEAGMTWENRRRQKREGEWEFVSVKAFWDDVCCPHTPDRDSQHRERSGQGNDLDGRDRTDR